MPGESVLDLTALTQLRELLGDGFEHTVSEYLTEAERLVAEARAAATRQDADGLSRATHSLKSASATVGAQTLTRLCAEIEHLATGGDVTSAAALLGGLADQHEAVTGAIRALGSGS